MLRRMLLFTYTERAALPLAALGLIIVLWVSTLTFYELPCWRDPLLKSTRVLLFSITSYIYCSHHVPYLNIQYQRISQGQLDINYLLTDTSIQRSIKLKNRLIKYYDQIRLWIVRFHESNLIEDLSFNIKWSVVWKFQSFMTLISF